jgi:hypothetical protein
MSGSALKERMLNDLAATDAVAFKKGLHIKLGT